YCPDAGLQFGAGWLWQAVLMRVVSVNSKKRHFPACRSADTSARPFFGHYITGQEILSGRGVTEQELGHYQQLAYLTPLIAKLVFCPHAGL
ncbi:hypothetical protein OFN21_28460, partial [Escherichia coli]|nr:hypothetical protein [Escherichia coli]